MNWRLEMYQLLFKIALTGLIFIDLFSANKKSKSVNFLRDPFFLPVKNINSKDFKLKLLGIIFNTNNYGALLQVGEQIYTVFLHDEIQGFKVLQIKEDYVILCKGKNKKKLFME